MKYLKKAVQIFLIIICGVSLMALVITSLHYIPQNSHSSSQEAEFYLANNGSHIDIIFSENGKYKAYGWGSKVFFTEVETWDDLTYPIAFQALFTKPESLMRIVEYSYINDDWIKVKCSKEQFIAVKKMVHKSFKYENGDYIEYISPIKYRNTKFYEANGKYHAFKTCNTWVNKILYDADLRCCMYTLTSDAITDLYK